MAKQRPEKNAKIKEFQIISIQQENDVTIIKNNLHNGNRHLQKQQMKSMRKAEKGMKMDQKHSRTIERNGPQT